MNRVYLSIGLLFCILTFVYINFLSHESTPTVTDDTPEAWDPNYRARNMKSTLYAENGTINHEVFAASMEHYDILGFTLFQEPQYTIYADETEAPWKIIAKEGTLYGGERIELEQNVLIQSLNPTDFVQTIEASFIEIDLITKTMVSDEAVVIRGQNYVINSNGFTANLVTRKLELKDHVETIYQQ